MKWDKRDAEWELEGVLCEMAGVLKLSHLSLLFIVLILAFKRVHIISANTRIGNSRVEHKKAFQRFQVDETFL